MNSIIKLPKHEREILFRNTAAKCGLSEGIVEKDFWVCWTLDYLFHKSPWKNHLAFKGGTSLSKCFDLFGFRTAPSRGTIQKSVLSGRQRPL